MLESSPNSPEFNQFLKYQEYCPNKISISGREIKKTTEDIVFYFGGTFENYDSKSTEDLKQSFADYSGNTCYSFSATAKIDDIFEFIKKIKQESKEQGKNPRFVFSSYSQGSTLNIGLTKKVLDWNNEIANNLVLTDKNQEEMSDVFEKSDIIELGGSILLAPTSLYPQENLRNKFKSEIQRTMEVFKENKQIRKKMWKNGKWLLVEGLTIGIPKLTGIHMKDTPSLKEQVKNMGSVLPDLGKIKSRIVIVQGKYDDVSNPKETNLEVFAKSDKVCRVTAEKLGNHFLSVFRSEQVAKVSLWQLHRQAA